MPSFNDDELNDPTVVAKTTQPTTAKPTSGVTEGLSITWGNKELSKREGLEEARSTKERNSRVWIIPDYSLAAAHTHWLDSAGAGKGATCRCLSNGDDRGSCPACQQGIRRDLRVVALVAYYKNADGSGKLPAEMVPEVEIRYLKLSRTNYAAIGELAPEDGTLSDVDLVMYNDPARPIGYLFKATQSRIRQHKMESQVSTLAKAAMADPTALTRRLGKKITAVEMRATLTGVATADAVPDADISSFDDY